MGEPEDRAARSNGARIGVLAIQGDFEAHAAALRGVGAAPVLVKHARELAQVDGLILPGGESTTLLKFLTEEGLLEAIGEVMASGRPLFGTCAGAILMAREVSNPPQPSLALMDIGIRRNAYGRQVSSFIARGNPSGGWSDASLEMVFIRAPIIERVGPRVQVLAECRGAAVLVRQQHLLASTFHPELSNDLGVHQYFLDMTERSRTQGSSRK